MIEANRLAVLEALSAGDSDEAVRVRVSPPAGESWSAANARAIAAEFRASICQSAALAGHSADRVVVFVYLGDRPVVGGRLGSAVEELD